MKSKLPTKEQIKEKYNITDDDFKILTELPTKEDVIKNKYGKLIRLGSIFGLNAWMLTSITGLLIAVIILPPKVKSTIDEAVEFWKPVASYTIEVGKEIVQNIQWPEEGQEIKSIAILPRKLEFKTAKEFEQLDEYPQETEIYPVSGTMNLG